MTCPSEIERHVELTLGTIHGWPSSRHVELAPEDVSWLEQRAIRLARSKGYSWGELGRLLATSRQAVRQKFGDIDGTPQPLPCRPTHDDERFMASWNEAGAGRRRPREVDDLGPGEAVPW